MNSNYLNNVSEFDLFLNQFHRQFIFCLLFKITNKFLVKILDQKFAMKVAG